MKAIRFSGIALGVAALVCWQRPAGACGGTFCDSGPSAMPVDQKGENILFVTDGTTVEAHVQIQYKGDPSRFAWIVPMPAVPVVTVGSELLFTNLLQATVPSYGYFVQQDSCPCYNCFNAGGSASFGGAAGGFGVDAGAADGGVTVIFRKSVGAFEVTALQGHSATEVVDWLSNNGYQSISTAPSILDKYVQKGSVFVAVKLTASAGNDEIHPLVFKYNGTEPCIPLELTAVAAIPDMGVRAFFLGSDRVVSTNYAHVTLNPARIDWSSMGSNYNDVVSKAVDAAGGHAFVTEYAGPSNIVSQYGFVDGRWDESAFVGLTAGGAVRELTTQGLLYCYDTGVPIGDSGTGKVCTGNHPLILPLLHDLVPVPRGVAEGAFYSCVDCFGASPDAAAFDSQKFAQALHDRIFEPARHAVALLARWSHLTRLFTTISPSEMTLDPFFETRKGLPDVSLPASATWRRTMQSASGFKLPTGEDVALANGSTWPSFTSAMPWAARIDAYPAGKPVELVADNSGAIQAQLDSWNSSQGWPAPPPDCPGPPSGSGGSGLGGTAGGVSGPAGNGGASGAGGSNVNAGGTTADGGVPRTAPPVSFVASDSGCGVARRFSNDAVGWLAALGGLVAMARRRRPVTRR